MLVMQVRVQGFQGSEHQLPIPLRCGVQAGLQEFRVLEPH